MSTRSDDPELNHQRGWAEVSILAIGLVFPSLITYIFFVATTELGTTIQQAAMGIGKTIQFLLPVIWWFGVRGERFALGRPGRSGWIVGALFGLAVAATMWFGYFNLIEPANWIPQLPVQVAEKVADLGCDTKFRYVALGVFYTIVHSLLEEYYWRWFIFGGLKRHTSAPMAILISSIGFMGHHVIVLAKFLGWASPATWIFSLAVGVGGAVWAWLYHRTGQLYPAWLSHLIVDAAIFTLGYAMLF